VLTCNGWKASQNKEDHLTLSDDFADSKPVSRIGGAGPSLGMAGALAWRALRTVARVESVTKWNPLVAGHISQFIGHKDSEDDKQCHSEPSSARPQGLELPRAPQGRWQSGASSMFPPALIPAHLSAGSLFHLNLRSLHSSAVCFEVESGQAEETKERDVIAGVVPKSDAVRDTKALLRTATLTLLREQLRDHERAWVTLPELYTMCKETGEFSNLVGHPHLSSIVHGKRR
jgi:hypothetical protein